MKISTTVSISMLLVAGFGLAAVHNATTSTGAISMDSALMACVTMPYCGGPDLASPVLKPKENKTETQDAKDGKLV